MLHHFLKVAASTHAPERLRLIDEVLDVVVEIERIWRYEAGDEVASGDILHFLDLFGHRLPLGHDVLIQSLVAPVEVVELVLITLLAQTIAENDVKILHGEQLAVFAKLVQESLLLLLL